MIGKIIISVASFALFGAAGGAATMLIAVRLLSNSSLSPDDVIGRGVGGMLLALVVAVVSGCFGVWLYLSVG